MGRVQWDPAREMEMSDLDRKTPLPRRCLKRRDIQIGLKDRLSEMYVASVNSIENVTQLAGKLKEAHTGKSESEVSLKEPRIPIKLNSGDKKGRGAAARAAIGESLYACLFQGEVD